MHQDPDMTTTEGVLAWAQRKGPSGDQTVADRIGTAERVAENERLRVVFERNPGHTGSHVHWRRAANCRDVDMTMPPRLQELVDFLEELRALSEKRGFALVAIGGCMGESNAGMWTATAINTQAIPDAKSSDAFFRAYIDRSEEAAAIIEENVSDQLKKAGEPEPAWMN